MKVDAMNIFEAVCIVWWYVYAHDRVAINSDKQPSPLKFYYFTKSCKICSQDISSCFPVQWQFIPAIYFITIFFWLNWVWMAGFAKLK